MPGNGVGRLKVVAVADFKRRILGLPQPDAVKKDQRSL